MEGKAKVVILFVFVLFLIALVVGPNFYSENRNRKYGQPKANAIFGLLAKQDIKIS